VTTLIAGSTDTISREQMTLMVSETQQLLNHADPISVTLGRILYHPEAIMLGVEPVDALRPVLDATRTATRTVTGQQGSINGESPSWVPHMTVSYSTEEQPASPIVSGLGKSVHQRSVLINSVTLVIQWGPERRWDWEAVGTAYFGHSLTA
jgi:hypothetical protein